MLYDQINNAENEKENLHTEMEILNDRIKTLSEMVDKTRVNNTILVVVLYFQKKGTKYGTQYIEYNITI